MGSQHSKESVSFGKQSLPSTGKAKRRHSPSKSHRSRPPYVSERSQYCAVNKVTSTVRTQRDSKTVPATDADTQKEMLDRIEITENRDANEIECSTSESVILSQQNAPVPAKLKRFRVNVPSSMEAGDIMSIKLGGIWTKILITTPTAALISKQVKQHDKGVKMVRCSSVVSSPSRDSTSCSATTVSSSSSAHNKNRNSINPSQNTSNRNKIVFDSVIASTEAVVPEGKMIVEAKAVIVLHAVFEESDKELKDQMIDETMKAIIQETVDNGCNSILGMTISIKEQKNGTGYFIKACGTPCLLVPSQVSLLPPANVSMARKRTYSESSLPPERRQ